MSLGELDLLQLFPHCQAYNCDEPTVAVLGIASETDPTVAADALVLCAKHEQEAIDYMMAKRQALQ